MMNLYELSKSIRTINQENGWEAPTWDKLLLKLMLVVTELNEARDAVNYKGKDPLEEELADTAIRLLDILGSIWGDDWSDRRNCVMLNEKHHWFQPIETILWKPLALLCMAVEAWRDENRTDVKVSLELALRDVYFMATCLGFDLTDEIHKKMVKNAGRGKNHGRARSEG